MRVKLPCILPWLHTAVVRFNYPLALFASALLFLSPAGLSAQTPVNFGSITLGAAGKTLPVTFTLPATATLGMPQVLTQGAPNLDFTLATGGTCSGSVTSGTTCTVNATFKPTVPGVRNGAVELQDPSGNILATTYIHGTGTGPAVAFSLPPQLVLGSGFVKPNGVAVDGSGNIFVANTFSNVVEEIVAAGGYSTIKNIGSGFSFPEGLALDGAGNLFVADSGSGLVKEVLAAGGYTTVNNLDAGYYSDLTSLAVDGNGNVFVADGGYGVREVPATGGYFFVAGNPDFVYAADVSVDGSGNLFVTDSGDYTVKEVLAAGGYTTVKAIGSGFVSPYGLAVDGLGNVFVTDPGDAAVKEILAAGGYTSVNILASGLSYPFSVAVDGLGNAFVPDAQGGIRELQRSQPPSLSFASTVVGSTSVDSPQAVTVLNSGNAPLSLTGSTVSANFLQVAGSGTPADCTGTTSLAASASCNLSLSFIPTEVGPISGVALLTDNALNQTMAKQSIPLSGTGTSSGTPATPLLSLASGTFPTPQTVTITGTTPGAVIYYTPDGSQPTASSVLYTHPLSISGTETVKAVAILNGISSTTASATYTIDSVNFPAGFATAVHYLKLNGSATLVGPRLQLTSTDVQYQAGSAFYITPVNISLFSTNFTFQLIDPAADGITFTIQSESPQALGSDGGGLGYQNIGKSVAVKFDLHDNAGEGDDSTGVYIDGAPPTVPAYQLESEYLGSIDLRSGHVFNVSILCGDPSQELDLTITDTVTKQSRLFQFGIDVPGTVGSDFAYIGFTGATGSKTATQQILTWTFTNP